MHNNNNEHSRRKFLGFAAAGVATAGGAALALSGAVEGAVEGAASTSDTSEAESGPTTTTTPLRATSDYAKRTLVVVELSGGNDGLATVVPRDAGVLYDLRPEVHIPDEELLELNDEFGWNPSLERLSGHGVAVLLGLGTTNDPDGSHFEMERRWWSGKSSGDSSSGTGFLGRLCDQLETDQPVTGLAIGSGANPALLSDKAVTLGLSDPGAAWFLDEDDPWLGNYRRGFGDMSLGSTSGISIATASIANARRGLSDTLAFGETLGEIDRERIDERYPNGDLGWKLGLAAGLLDQDAGVRVVHVTHGGFDTHSDQRGDHDDLLMQLSEAVSAFLEDVGDRGRGDSTLVCTTSEFGRRVSNNDGGTDHGAASVALLAGPVTAGVHGEVPSLSALDDENLVATTDFEQYYATLAERWFGIPSSEVLESAATPLDDLI